MGIRTRHWLIAYFCLLAEALVCPPSCLAEEPENCRLSLPAGEAFQQGQGAWDVRLHDGGAVGLYDRVLVEDDGPGIGSDAEWMKTNRAPTTEIAGNTRVKKVLHVGHHQAMEARLCAPTGVAIEMNGRPLDVILRHGLSPGPRLVVERRRQRGRSLLPRGRPPENQVRHPGRHPPQRARAQGPAPPQFHQRRRWKDLGAARGRVHGPLAPGAICAAGPFRLSRDRSGSKPSAARCRRRFFSAHASLDPVRCAEGRCRDAGWHARGVGLPYRSQPGVRGGDVVRLAAGGHRGVSPGHRYLQWKAVLASRVPLQTPLLRSVAVEAKVRRQPLPAWARHPENGGLP